MKSFAFVQTFALAASLVTPMVWAQVPASDAGGRAAAPLPVMKDAAQGEVRKVDRDAKKITIKHGPIKNLDMPAMTMVFQVRDASLLDALTAGDTIRFTAEQVQGAYVVTGARKVSVP